MKTFITAISMQGTLTKGEYKPVGFTLEHNRETAFPIIPIIAEAKALDGEDEFEVIAVVPKNSDTANNYRLFIEELSEAGVSEETVKKIEIREDQSTAVGIAMFTDILRQISDDSDIYACITYGTKAITVLMVFALIFAEKLKVNCQVQGMYYGELKRKANTEVERRLYDLVSYLQLKDIADSISEMEVPDAEGLFSVIIGEKKDEGNGQ